MKLGILFSGGKDSTFATYLAKKNGYEISCLVSLFSENKESFMFHTPSIEMVREQAKAMEIPIIIGKTKGKKEEELEDLEKAIKFAIKKHKINGIVTGAIESVYQSSRIQKICNKLRIECFNPLWQKNPEEYWSELLKEKFEIIITGVFADGLDKSWLGQKIDKKSLSKLRSLVTKFGIHLSFEGGEAETFVTDCPLFKRKLKVVSFRDYGRGNSWRREVSVR